METYSISQGNNLGQSKNVRDSRLLVYIWTIRRYHPKSNMIAHGCSSETQRVSVLKYSSQVLMICLRYSPAK